MGNRAPKHERYEQMARNAIRGTTADERDEEYFEPREALVYALLSMAAQIGELAAAVRESRTEQGSP